jgi:hypothetical protein
MDDDGGGGGGLHIPKIEARLRMSMSISLDSYDIKMLATSALLRLCRYLCFTLRIVHVGTSHITQISQTRPDRKNLASYAQICIWKLFILPLNTSLPLSKKAQL